MSDRLNPEDVPACECFDGQPKELVAVLGSHAFQHWGPVHFVAFAPDGNRAASAGPDGVRIWNTKRDGPAEACRLPEILGPLAFSSDWKFIVHVVPRSEKGSKVVCRMLEGGEERGRAGGWRWEARIGEEQATALALSFDGNLVAVGCKSGTVHLWSGPLSTGLPTHVTLFGLKKGITALAFSPKEGLLAAGGADGRIRLWEMVGPLPKQIPHCFGENTEEGDGFRGLCFSADGRILASVERRRYASEGLIQLWALQQAGVVGHTRLLTRGTSVAFSPDDRRLAVGETGGAVTLIDLAGPIPKRECQSVRLPGGRLPCPFPRTTGH